MTAIIDDVNANERTYDCLRAELEHTCREQWVVIAQGHLIASAPMREEALQQTEQSPTEARSRLARKVGEALPMMVRDAEH